MTKSWQVGTADETWKIIICARDIQRIDDLVSALCYYGTDCGFDEAAGKATLNTMSGKDILDSLLAKRASCYESVRKGLQKQ